MDTKKTYFELVKSVLDTIYHDENAQENLEKAVTLIAEATKRGELIYIIGPGGHSNMAAEECMCRAGVLANINPMIDATNLFNGTVKSRLLQRNPAYAAGVLDQYYIPEGSVLIIVNAYGINALTVELAMEAKRRNLVVVAISSLDHSSKALPNQPGRHPSKKTLYDVADIYINNHMPFGDATIEIEGVDQPLAPVSTIANSFVIQTLMLRAVEKTVEIGGTPDVWRSINLPGGDEYDERLFSEYGKRIKYLL